MATRKSVTSVVHEYNEVVFCMEICETNKQVQFYTQNWAFYSGVKRTIVVRRFFESLGKAIQSPTISYEDNNAAIQQIQARQLTLKVKHLDIMITWLHEQHSDEKYVAIYCNTNLNKSDTNTKAHGGKILQEKNLSMVGFKFYPPEGSVHYDLLQLAKYNIGVHMGFPIESKEGDI